MGRLKPKYHLRDTNSPEAVYLRDENDREFSIVLERHRATLFAAAPDLLEALKDVFALMEEGVLVRDISHDGNPDYSVRMMGLVSRLKKAHDAVAKAEDRSDV